MASVSSFESHAEDTETLLRKLGAWEANEWGEDGASPMLQSNREDEDNVEEYYRYATIRERVMI